MYFPCRALCVVLLTWVANRFGREEQISKVEQFIMTYGGLRGAVAFCLAILLDDGNTSQSSELKRYVYSLKFYVCGFLIGFYWWLEGFTSVSSLIWPLRILGESKQSPPSTIKNRYPKLKIISKYICGNLGPKRHWYIYKRDYFGIPGNKSTQPITPIHPTFLHFR